MGRNIYNVEAVCDHAMPEKYSALRLHMDLSVSREEFQEIHESLSKNDWVAVENMMVPKYPEHKETIVSWLKNSQARALGENRQNAGLRVVNG